MTEPTYTIETVNYSEEAQRQIAAADETCIDPYQLYLSHLGIAREIKRQLDARELGDG